MKFEIVALIAVFLVACGDEQGQTSDRVVDGFKSGVSVNRSSSIAYAEDQRAVSVIVDDSFLNKETCSSLPCELSYHVSLAYQYGSKSDISIHVRSAYMGADSNCGVELAIEDGMSKMGEFKPSKFVECGSKSATLLSTHHSHDESESGDLYTHKCHQYQTSLYGRGQVGLRAVLSCPDGTAEPSVYLDSIDLANETANSVVGQ